MEETKINYISEGQAKKTNRKKIIIYNITLALIVSYAILINSFIKLLINICPI